MTDHKVYAWILISVPEFGGTAHDIMAMAGAINRVDPSQDELENGLRWLKQSRLLIQVGKHFLLTDQGAHLLARVKIAGQSIVNFWSAVTTELEALHEQSACP
jgi:hypothetical protein